MLGEDEQAELTRLGRECAKLRIRSCALLRLSGVVRFGEGATADMTSDVTYGSNYAPV